MRKSFYETWLDIGFDAVRLNIEASHVVMLRTARIARGGQAGEREAQRMIDEKVEAGIDFQTALVTGRAGYTPQATTRSALSHYGRKVRANRRRLSKPS